MEPTPENVRHRTEPYHYIVIPRKMYSKDSITFQRTIFDPAGWFDTQLQKLIAQEVTYTFIKDVPTIVAKEDHVIFLLQKLEGVGAYECAVVRKEDNVEYFYPKNSPRARAMTEQAYDTTRVTEVRTPVWRPVPAVVVRTAAEVLRGEKLHVELHERLLTAEQLLTMSSEPDEEDQVEEPASPEDEPAEELPLRRMPKGSKGRTLKKK